MWHWISVTEDVENKLKSSCNYLWSLLFCCYGKVALLLQLSFFLIDSIWRKKKTSEKYEKQRVREQAIEKSQMQFHIKIDSEWAEEAA